MEKPVLRQVVTLGQLMIQKYESYLPTAFDEGMTLIQKVNMIVDYVNRMGVVNDDLVAQWSEVMEWVTTNGLEETINLRIDEMVSDGTLGNLLNQSVMDRVDRITRDVKEYNALGDGVNDDTQAIIDTISSASEGDTVLVPSGQFRTTQTIIVDKNINFVVEGIIIVDHEGTGVELRDLGRGTLINSRHVISVKRKTTNFTDTNAKGVVLNGCYNQSLDLRNVTGFYYGLLMVAELGKGCVYNEITLHVLKDNKKQISLYGEEKGSTDAEKSWINQNTFIAGRMSWSLEANRDGFTGIEIGDGSGYLPNGNVFLNPSIEDVGYEGKYATPIICDGHDNMIIAPRTEGGKAFIFSSRSFNNKVNGGFYTTLADVVDSGAKNEFDFSRGGFRKWALNNVSGNEFIASGSGTHALKLYNKTSANNPVLGIYDASGTNLESYITAVGEVQYRNNVKHFHGTYIAPPTSGTWTRNTVLWRNNPSAGQYIGWVCVMGGTPGTWKGFGMIES